VVAALQRGGFQTVRIKGSHHLLRHADGRSTVVPVHPGETIGPGLLAQILRDCKITRDQLRAWL
jgi:predicted RNA binding protein YcfA (HicA-like mRNA interferase family)